MGRETLRKVSPPLDEVAGRQAGRREGRCELPAVKSRSRDLLDPRLPVGRCLLTQRP